VGRLTPAAHVGGAVSRGLTLLAAPDGSVLLANDFNLKGPWGLRLLGARGIVEARPGPGGGAPSSPTSHRSPGWRGPSSTSGPTARR
jgi:hypothetical protein